MPSESHSSAGSPGLGQLAWVTTGCSTRSKGRLQASGLSFVPYDIGLLHMGPDGDAVSCSSDCDLFPASSSRSSDLRVAKLVPIPVTDVDRAEPFHVDQVGFNADHESSGHRPATFRAAHSTWICMLDRDRNRDHRDGTWLSGASTRTVATIESRSPAASLAINRTRTLEVKASSRGGSQ
jgi:hypothetical protein